MTTALRAEPATDPEHVVACLGFKNAFGAIERTTIDVLRGLCVCVHTTQPGWMWSISRCRSRPCHQPLPQPCGHYLYDGLPKILTPDGTPIQRSPSGTHSGAARQLARQAGLTASTEQATVILDQIMPDGQPAPGSVRPIHRADVHIIEPGGSELWLDIKIDTVAPNLAIAKELLRDAAHMPYGQRNG